ncbi:hypothetical protein K227x_33030 [Rubripirellula lacrimiformis]|uniref:Uncharacterized protein n=1 Tax=Rubripirellula lacrimiformis TaxID=1930273 RepID=A0A517NCS4_9BACT|nr:hypothetical protein K227x_33030 [Rubripirellula lacrimiformis]
MQQLPVTVRQLFGHGEATEPATSLLSRLASTAQTANAAHDESCLDDADVNLSVALSPRISTNESRNASVDSAP